MNTNKKTNANHPKVTGWLLRKIIQANDYDYVVGDLNESYQHTVAEKGRLWAWFWCWQEVLRSFPRFVKISVGCRYAVFMNYLKIVFRNIRKYKAYSFINIAGLATGMACCLLILLWVHDEWQYDRYHKNTDRIFRVYGKGLINTSEINMPYSPAPMAETLVDDCPEVESAVRLYNPGEMLVKHGDRNFTENRFLFADASIFEVFTFPMIRGNPETALIRPHSLVLTKSTAHKYFGDEDPMGRMIVLNNGTDYQVTGIVEDVPRQSHFHFDILGSLSSLDVSRTPHWISNTFYTYLVLKEGYAPVALESKFPAMIAKYMGPHVQQEMGVSYEQFLASGNRYGYYLQSLADIHLHSNLNNELEANGDIRYVTIFSAIALFVLLIACANYMNLATARSAARAKEVGIRKVIGSNRAQLIRQFLAESVTLSILSLLIALLLTQLLMPIFGSLSGKSLNLKGLANVYWMIGLVGFTILVGVLAGSCPAFYLASFRPVAVMKGRIRAGMKQSRLRSGLVVFQFGISIFLIVATLVISKQLRFIQNRKLGFEKEHLVLLQGGQSLGQQKDAFKEALLKHPNVYGVTGSSTVPGKRFGSTGFRIEQATAGQMHMLLQIYADHDFMRTYGIKIIKGRDFSREMSTDVSNVIINESAAHTFGLLDPTGKRIVEVHPDPTFNTMLNIIGVVQDFHSESMHRRIQPLAIHLFPDAMQYLSIRIAPDDVAGTLDYIKKQWVQFASGQPFDPTFLDREYDALYSAEQRTGQLYTAFSVLSIFIACMGLLGLASFYAEQRTKEIGIRKVLGSSVRGIVLLTTREFVKWVVMANVLAWPLAYFVMHRWLQNFAYQTQIGIDVYVLSAGLALVIALSTVGYQIIRAARADPVDALRYE